jgi:hypothetical protein
MYLLGMNWFHFTEFFTRHRTVTSDVVHSI